MRARESSAGELQARHSEKIDGAEGSGDMPATICMKQASLAT